MQRSHRNFIIFSKHRRLTRIWQFFFTGWGLVMVVVLVAAPLLTKQILWSPITAIDMRDIVTNQFKITNASFAGLDKDGNPFKIHAKTGYQEYGNPDIVFLEKPNGKITRSSQDKKIKETFSAKSGQFDIKEKVLTLHGNVHIDDSDGNKTLTNEMVFKL